MRSLVLSGLILLVGCAAVPKHVAVRREMGHRMWVCHYTYPIKSFPTKRQECFTEVGKLCRKYGQHETCGYDELWGMLYR